MGSMNTKRTPTIDPSGVIKQLIRGFEDRHAEIIWTSNGKVAKIVGSLHASQLSSVLHSRYLAHHPREPSSDIVRHITAILHPTNDWTFQLSGRIEARAFIGRETIITLGLNFPMTKFAETQMIKRCNMDWQGRKGIKEPYQTATIHFRWKKQGVQENENKDNLITESMEWEDREYYERELTPLRIIHREENIITLSCEDE